MPPPNCTIRLGLVLSLVALASWNVAVFVVNFGTGFGPGAEAGIGVGFEPALAVDALKGRDDTGVMKSV